MYHNRARSELSLGPKRQSQISARETKHEGVFYVVCVLQGWFAFKNVPDISVLLLSMDKLDPRFHFGKEKEIY